MTRGRCGHFVKTAFFNHNNRKGCDNLQNIHLQQVVSFGSIGLIAGVFMCVGDILLPATDVPDAVEWTNTKAMFYAASAFN